MRCKPDCSSWKSWCGPTSESTFACDCGASGGMGPVVTPETLDCIRAIAHRVQTVGVEYSYAQRSIDGNALHTIASVLARSAPVVPTGRESAPQGETDG